MEQDFATASHGAHSPASLVFVSDVNFTLSLREGKTNKPLLKLLSDASKAGHRVIITSRSLSSLEDLFDMWAMRDPSLDLSQFELVAKADLAHLKSRDGSPLEIDYIFDDETPSYAPVYGLHIQLDGFGTGAPSLPYESVRTLSGLGSSSTSPSREPALL